jgi:hypothetical protein
MPGVVTKQILGLKINALFFVVVAQALRTCLYVVMWMVQMKLQHRPTYLLLVACGCCSRSSAVIYTV